MEKNVLIYRDGVEISIKKIIKENRDFLKEHLELLIKSIKTKSPRTNVETNQGFFLAFSNFSSFGFSSTFSFLTSSIWKRWNNHLKRLWF